MPTSNINTTNTGTLALLRALVPRRPLIQVEALQIAELQAARLRQHLNITTPEFPAHALALSRIRIERDQDLPTSGMAFWDGSNWVIVVNASEAPTRQRFSLAHEFKHIVDHTSHHFLYGPDAERNDPTAERAADYFAACLLMPKLLVKRHWGRGPRTTDAMAATFGVSPAAMKYRLDQLGLVDEPQRCGWRHRIDQTDFPPTLELAA